jgi:uncharacterized OB-fold protein
MPDLIVKTYYDKLANGELVGLKCTECGTVSFPPKAICNSCGNLETEWISMSGRGELRIYSVVNYPGGEFQEVAPYAFGLIKLEEGPVFYGMVDGVDLEDPWAGNQSLPVDVAARVETVGTKTFPLFVANGK